MTRERLFAIFFFAVLLFLLYQFYLVLEVFIVPICWAALLALTFYPLQSALTRWFGGRAAPAALVLTTLVIALVMVPAILLSTLLVAQSVAAYQGLREAFDTAQLPLWVERARSWFVAFLPARAVDLLESAVASADLPAVALRATNAVSGFLVAQAGEAVRNAVRFVVNFFLTTFALFFFFRDGAAMARYVRLLLPMEEADKETILSGFYETLTAVVQGALVTAVVQGSLAGLGYWAVNVPFSVLFGALAGFLSLLPGGAGVIGLPLVGYTAFTQPWYYSVGLALWQVMVVGTSDNVVRIWIIGGRAEIPTVFLFFGMLGGMQVYGLLGMFVGPVLVATLLAVVRIYRERYALP
jgi:predicted PurR-regulated permease PerM